METVKRAIIIVHGKNTAFKAEIMDDLEKYFDKFNYIESELSTEEIMTQHEGELLVNKISESVANPLVMNVYIDSHYSKQETEDAFFFSSQNVLPSVVAGNIIIKHITWCKKHSLLPVY